MSLRAEDTQINQMSIQFRRIKQLLPWAILIVFVMWPALSPSQSPQAWNKLDRQAKAIRYIGQSLPELTGQITRVARTDLDKARALFTWTATHLYYDQLNSDQEANWDNRQPIAIIARGKGVCWDYATVFQALCQRAGILCLRVTGYAPVRIPDSRIPELPNHAWNVFRIDSTWYLADVTWQSGAPEGNDLFQMQTGNDYFGTPPGLFATNHLPEHPMYQLLDCPLSPEEFAMTVRINPQALRTPCPAPYVYIDTLNQYLDMEEGDRGLWYQQGVYRFRPTTANQRYLDQSITDHGIAFQGLGDEWYSQGSYARADSCYTQAIAQFDQIKDTSSLFDWQLKAIGLTWFNRGMTCLKLSGGTCPTYFQKAREVLEPYQEDVLLTPVIKYLKQQKH